VWREKLGGRRAAQKDSINRGWKNESFRGYADYMQTQEFAAQMDWLTSLADLNTVTVRCAEAVPWRCHRSLIADAVLARGIEVQDIYVSAEGKTSIRPHCMTKFAKLEDGKLRDTRSRANLDSSEGPLRPQDAVQIVPAAARTIRGYWKRWDLILWGPAKSSGDWWLPLRVQDAVHAVFDRARAHFNEQELLALVFTLTTINAWNRLAITMCTEVGNYQPKARPVSPPASN
jgi:hypothetical protein